MPGTKVLFGIALLRQQPVLQLCLFPYQTSKVAGYQVLVYFDGVGTSSYNVEIV